MFKNSQNKVASFPGCTTQDMKDHIKPLLRRNPDEIIIHVGTISLRSPNTPQESAGELIDLAETVSSESSAVISISILITEVMMKLWPPKYQTKTKFLRNSACKELGIC